MDGPLDQRNDLTVDHAAVRQLGERFNDRWISGVEIRCRSATQMRHCAGMQRSGTRRA
jgi:hypothetical protein